MLDSGSNGEITNVRFLKDGRKLLIEVVSGNNRQDQERIDIQPFAEPENSKNNNSLFKNIVSKKIPAHKLVSRDSKMGI